MKYLSLIILFFGLACSGNKNLKKQQSIKEISSSSITLLRGGCYGSCPMYSVTIFSDGKVSYEGRAYVDNVGEYSGNISSDESQLLFSKLSRYDWSAYPDKFPIDNVDFPQFTLTYVSGNFSKSVKANSRAAEELVALSKELDLLIKDVDWKKDE